MPKATIPVDLRNPGQVFACLGFMEATEILCGPCTGGYEYRGSETGTTFGLEVDGSLDPVEATLRFLASAEVEALVPHGSDLSVAKWDVPARACAGLAYPFPVPDSPATLAVVLKGPEGHEIPIEHWGDDSTKTGRDNVKFWAGSGGQPGAALTQKLLAGIGAVELLERRANPFAIDAPQSSSFRFDWRRDYVPLDAGFSPNEHQSSMSMVGYPVVELLAAIGLQHARPERPNRRDKLMYRYGVSNHHLPTSFARAVLGTESLGFSIRTFRMRLGWPGKERQARCIIDAHEETAT